MRAKRARRVVGPRIEMGFFELVEGDETGNGFESGLVRLRWWRNDDIVNGGESDPVMEN